MDDVASEAGISRPSLYKHFKIQGQTGDRSDDPLAGRCAGLSGQAGAGMESACATCRPGRCGEACPFCLPPARKYAAC
ncbi:TetR family transcriptional regulator [Chromobacterium sphagni]|uniref:TetR family transcriptional regulator n=1 Tax=Chromobacterium sphagni TaxID=1903179 RepID=UPI001EFBB3DD|nr:TetR/AcrR family transcriptional regulator [Chromobacterium sphagni]